MSGFYAYSIIIPHKNNVNLLRRCLASVPRRDDVQVVIVDDDSDSNIVDFADFPGKDEENVVVVFTKQGKGAGYARNVGLRHATGRWVFFADCDDTFDMQALDYVMTDYLDSKYDVVYFNVRCVDATSNEIIIDALHNHYQQYLLADKDRENLCRYQIRVPWGKMVKKSLIDDHGIYFSEVPVGNDFMFSLKVGYYARCIEVVPDITLYDYYIGQESITSKSRSSALLLLQHLVNMKERNDFIFSHGLDVYRTNYFYSIPAIFRQSKRLAWRALFFSVTNTPFRYLFVDFFYACRIYVKKKCCR